MFGLSTKATAAPKPRLTLQWMNLDHVGEVLKIDRQGFNQSWDEKRFRAYMRHSASVAMVAVIESRVVGYVLYELESQCLHLRRLAVMPEYRRHGIGRALVNSILAKLTDRRYLLTTTVRESNLDAQLFFRSSGFLAIATLRKFYADTSEDAYLMQINQAKIPRPGL